MKLSKETKNILSILLVLVGIILLGNTNNNPVTFIERIFRPINMGSGTLYYSNVIPMILIYYGFKWMNEASEHRLLNTRNKRILATIIVLLFSNQLITYGIKTCKGMADDLNSIYYYRSNAGNSLSIHQNNGSDEIVTCRIELENCSDKSQEFYIKIFVPENYKELIAQREFVAKESDLKTPKKFVLHPGERRIVVAESLTDMKNNDISFGGSAREFEFSLINEKDEVKFIKSQ